MTTAASTTAITNLGAPTRSIGDVKIEIQELGIVSGDTAATATAQGLSRVDYAILVGDVIQTAFPTYSGNVATFAFTDPAATVKAQVLLFGR